MLIYKLKYSFEFNDDFNSSNADENVMFILNEVSSTTVLLFYVYILVTFHFQKADVVLGAIVLTDKRNNLVDFPYPWVKSAGALMIPHTTANDEKTQHDPTSKIGAIFKPFQTQVFIFIITYIHRYVQ